MQENSAPTRVRKIAELSLLATVAGLAAVCSSPLLEVAGRWVGLPSSMPTSIAQAQAACACSASGAQLGLVASEDAGQLFGESVGKGGWTVKSEQVSVDTLTYDAWALFKRIGEGPLVLTDLEKTSSVEVYAVAKGNPCVVPGTILAGSYPYVTVQTFTAPAVRRALFLSATSSVHGARIVVRADEKLCAFAGGNTTINSSAASANSGTDAALMWSGFYPYE